MISDLLYELYQMIMQVWTERPGGLQQFVSELTGEVQNVD